MASDDETAGRGSERLARGMALGLVAMGVLHFVAPGPFERIVPRALGRPRLWVHLSGAAEIVSGVLTAVPRTRRTGALRVSRRAP